MIGSILFVRSSSTLSWIIRKLTRSMYSHVAISVSEDDSWIIEADLFQKVRPKYNPHKEFEVVDIPMTDRQKLELLEFLLMKTDVGYDYGQIAGLFLYLIGLTDKEGLWNSANKMICSELVDLSYKYAGVDLLPDVMDGIATPADLASILLKRPIIGR